MTNVNLIGQIKKVENKTYLEVSRIYKNRDGFFEKDLIPVIYWTKNEQNNLSYLIENTRVFIKGRLECLHNNLIVVVEEFVPL